MLIIKDFGKHYSLSLTVQPKKFYIDKKLSFLSYKDNTKQLTQKRFLQRGFNLAPLQKLFAPKGEILKATNITFKIELKEFVV